MNRREYKVAKDMKAKGWQIMTKGYPDLFCFKGNKIKFIEVKRKQIRPSKKMGLSLHQRTMIKIMKRAGLDVEVRYVK